MKKEKILQRKIGQLQARAEMQKAKKWHFCPNRVTLVCTRGEVRGGRGNFFNTKLISIGDFSEVRFPVFEAK